MKVILTNPPRVTNAQLDINFEQNKQLKIEQQVNYLLQQFSQRQLPCINADKILNQKDIEMINYKTQSAQTLYTDTIDNEQVAQTKYFYALFKKLADNHNRPWLESTFNHDLYFSDNSLSKIKEEPFYSNGKEQYQEDSSKYKFSLADLNEECSLLTKKDEWILFLDVKAILVPNFFKRLTYFSKLKISPEILSFSEPLKDKLLLDWLTNSKQKDQAWDELYNLAIKYNSNHTTYNNQYQRNLWNNKVYAPNLNGLDSVEDLYNELFSPDYTPSWIYKNKFSRYNNKLDSYFFVKIIPSDFSLTCFAVRASYLKKIVQNQPYLHLANDIFTLSADYTPDIGYIRAPWAVTPNSLPNILRNPYQHKKLSNLFTYFTRGLANHIRQMRLTASLDNNDMS